MSGPNEKAPRLGPGGASDRNRHSFDLGKTIPDDAGAVYKIPVVDPTPNTDAALEFLRAFAPNGPWMLGAIDPENPADVKTAVFSPEVGNAARKWLDERQGRLNLYYLVNETKGNRRRKEDVTAARALHVDLDPRVSEDVEAERGRAVGLLRAYSPPPTVIVDSGNGMQGLWLLDQPVPLSGDPSPVEGRNLAIELKLGADACHDASRLMRLPGTVNVPNEKKRSRGRKAAAASVVEAHWGRVYRLDDFPCAPRVNQPEGGAAPEVRLSADLPRLDSLEDLPSGVSFKTKQLIVQGCDPDDPARYPSRSEALFAVLCEMVRADCSDDQIAAVILDPDYGISAHVLEQPRSRQYAARQIQRARDEAADFIKVDGKIIANSQRNIRLAIRKLGVRVSYDQFARRNRIDGLEGFGPHLDDAAAARLWLLIDEKCGFRPEWKLYQTVLSDAARRDSFHPVHDYLDSLTWDGRPRLEGWLTTYGKAPDTAYTRAVGRLVLIAAVRRVRQPGAKFDEMLVLESPQGKDKSSALAVLAVNEDWFSDGLPLNADDKLVIERTSGKWIVEAGELNGITKQGVDKLKNLLSRRRDESRMAYGRFNELVPRQWIMVGTTNDTKYLRDQTGNRRFWPVKVEAFDLEALRRDRDQLWAEAAHLEAQGASIRLDPSLWDAAAAEQDARRVEDPFFDALHDALGEDKAGRVSAVSVWKIIGRQGANATQDENARMGAAMKRLGFDRKKLRFGEKTAWGYQRGEAADVLWSPDDPPWDR